MCAAVTICSTLVNIQTCTHPHRHTDNKLTSLLDKLSLQLSYKWLTFVHNFQSCLQSIQWWRTECRPIISSQNV